ncbi:MAG: hypothetical protein EBR58_11845 [Betaproteobacteria bacterium]|nr:hypothetical protein [Betaproteobacteria bacterium]
MTPAELSATLQRIGWTRSHLADRLGYASENSIRQWRTVPPPVVRYLEEIETALKILQPPQKTR